MRGLGLWAQLRQQPRQVIHQVPLLLDLPHQLLPQLMDGSGIRPGLGDANGQDEAEQKEEWEAEGMGAEVMEGILARKWELEGHQLWYHLPGGRVVCEEATVPGGVGAGEMGADRPVRTWGRSCWASPPSLQPSSPADHVGQRHCSQKQAKEQHQMEEEDGAGGSEKPWGCLGVPQEGVLLDVEGEKEEDTVE